MIKENQEFLNKLNIATDGVAIFLSMIAAFFIRFSIFPSELGYIELNYYIRTGVFILPLFLLLYSGFGLYESFRSHTFMVEISQIFKANFIGTAVLVAVFFVLKIVDISRLVLAIFFVVSVVFVSSKRVILRKVLRAYRKQGGNLKHVVILGSGVSSGEYLSAIRKNRSLGFNPAGYVSDDNGLTGLEKLGGFDSLDKVLSKLNPDEVVAALELEDYRHMQSIIDACEKNGCKLSIIPFYSKFMPAKPYIDEVEGIPLINIRRIPLDNLFNAFMKRSMDIIGSVLLILISSPIMLFAAAGTKCSSPGPVIFKQKRVGLNKHVFTMYKFRSMRVNGKEETGWTTDHDSRKTRFGAFIRKFSIDELPQFFNVLKGDMSLIGPRPELPHFVDEFSKSIPLYMVKHQVRPGITGWAQVNGFRGDTSIRGRVEHDIYYIEHWSLLFDIKILFLTLFKGLINHERLVG